MLGRMDDQPPKQRFLFRASFLPFWGKTISRKGLYLCFISSNQANLNWNVRINTLNGKLNYSISFIEGIVCSCTEIVVDRRLGGNRGFCALCGEISNPILFRSCIIAGIVAFLVYLGKRTLIYFLNSDRSITLYIIIGSRQLAEQFLLRSVGSSIGICCGKCRCCTSNQGKCQSTRQNRCLLNFIIASILSEIAFFPKWLYKRTYRFSFPPF